MHRPEILLLMALAVYAALISALLFVVPKPSCNEVHPVVIGNALLLGGCR